ncbi:MAG: hypothetical protein HYR62_03485 [Actinobacteria bacterium]|nr:hypothetical protein [Actinomycetota bacterium]MBI3688324.1 hypothetical protein [Actinomycetota bacterium]
MTPDQRTAPTPTPGPRRAPARRGGRVESPEYAAFARRIIRAHGRRIAAGDVEALPDLLALADELEHAAQHAVTGLRRAGYSWGEIAARLGTTRQAAHQRWGHYLHG